MIPEYTKQSIDLYVEKGYPPGGFLYAVLTNNFMDAVGMADDTNRCYLIDIATYIANYIPTVCYGSPEKVRNWLNAHKENLESIKSAINHDRLRRQNSQGE